MAKKIFWLTVAIAAVVAVWTGCTPEGAESLAPTSQSVADSSAVDTVPAEPTPADSTAPAGASYPATLANTIWGCEHDNVWRDVRIHHELRLVFKNGTEGVYVSHSVGLAGSDLDAWDEYALTYSYDPETGVCVFHCPEIYGSTPIEMRYDRMLLGFKLKHYLLRRIHY